MKRRTLWTAIGGVFLIVGAAIWLPTLRPLETPPWQKELEQQGVQFYPVPGNPDLSVCYVLLQMETGGQQWVRPALFVRNEGWSCRLSDITLQGTKDGEPFNYGFGALTCFPADEWGNFRLPAGTRFAIPGHSYTVIMSGVDELPAVMGEFNRSFGEEFLPPFAPIDVASAVHADDSWL